MIWFTRVAIFGALYSFGAVALLHWLCRDYDVIMQPLSYYAVGEFGWVMTTVFLASATSMFALARAIVLIAPQRFSIGRALPNIVGACLLIAGIFPTDITTNNTPETLIGLIHVIASYTFAPCLVAATLLLSRDFDRDARHPIFALAVSVWASFILLSLANIFDWQIGGIGQRVFLLLAMMWVIAMAMRLKDPTGFQNP
ncbi:MAG: DUF998 domain-containing protein [Chloroflexi bacterium]|nr:DUF998 domain-containing protein [Chloroflexota bacterium]